MTRGWGIRTGSGGREKLSRIGSHAGVCLIFCLLFFFSTDCFGRFCIEPFFVPLADDEVM